MTLKCVKTMLQQSPRITLEAMTTIGQLAPPPRHTTNIRGPTPNPICHLFTQRIPQKHSADDHLVQPTSNPFHHKSSMLLYLQVYNNLAPRGAIITEAVTPSGSTKHTSYSISQIYLAQSQQQLSIRPPTQCLRCPTATSCNGGRETHDHLARRHLQPPGRMP